MAQFLNELHKCVKQEILYTGVYDKYSRKWYQNNNKLYALSTSLQRVFDNESVTKKMVVVDYTIIDNFIASLYEYLLRYNVRNVNKCMYDPNIAHKPSLTLFDNLQI